MTSLTRRLALKLIGLGSAWLGFKKATHAQDASASSVGETTIVSWKNTHDRVWLGSEIWANPMEDWRVVDGTAECQTTGGDRNLHLITHQLTDATGSIAMSVVVHQVEVGKQDGGVGFRIGIRSELNEHRSNCFASGGVNAGLVNGNMILGRQQAPIDVDLSKNVKLSLSGRPSGQRYQLTLSAHDASGKKLGELTQMVATEAILGNVALVNNFDPKLKQRQGGRYRFDQWSVGGDAFSVSPERKFGPILWSMYSLSDSRSDEGFVMKISALTGPLGANDNKDVELFVQRGDAWKSLGTAALDTDAWTATFRIANWDEKTETPFKLVYAQQHIDGSETPSTWSGKIKANPAGRPLRIGALTCQNHYGFPYEPVAENLIKLDPDMLYFSGDQLYESHGGYGLIRDPAEPAILNYLRKYYMHGWSFREAMRDRPTICIADDHDVFQGNIWGEGGTPMDVDDGGASSNGGYREPARMVNVVHKTNTAHHPDYYDPTPCCKASASTTAIWFTAESVSPFWAIANSRVVRSMSKPAAVALTTCWTRISTPNNWTNRALNYWANVKRSSWNTGSTIGAVTT